MTRRYRKDHDLMGYEADDLLSIFDTLKEDDVWQYRYPDDYDLNAVGIHGIYLGNYVRWDPKAQHEKMIRELDYRTAAFPRTFDCYDYVDCFNYMDIHDQLKLYKHGYSKVTDHASREIRFGRLTRDQGLALVKQLEQAPLKYHKQFCEWLGVTPQALQFMLDQHRSSKYWSQPEFGKWEFNGWSNRQVNAISSTSSCIERPINFQSNERLEYDRDSNYITLGKGWP